MSEQEASAVKPEEQEPRQEEQQKPSEEPQTPATEGEVSEKPAGNVPETPPETEPATEPTTEEAAAAGEEEEPDDGVPIVLVTGASGFIASHLIKLLLEQGSYHVRGTVRNKKKQEKVAIKEGLTRVTIGYWGQPLHVCTSNYSGRRPRCWK